MNAPKHPLAAASSAPAIGAAATPSERCPVCGVGLTEEDELPCDTPACPLNGPERGNPSPGTQTEKRAETGGPVLPPVGAGSPTFLVTADSSTVSMRDFLDAMTGSSDETREARRELNRQRCIRAIERGDVFGFPPSLVAECKQIMAEEDASLVYVERIAPGRVAL